MSDYAELKRLAEDAIQHSEKIGEHDWYHENEVRSLLLSSTEDAQFVSAARPEVVLALIAENEALRKDADKWQIVERAMTQLQSDEQDAAIWSACSRILISVANELNSSRSVVTEEGVTSDGVEIGDWRVTVERIDAALSKGERP